MRRLPSLTERSKWLVTLGGMALIVLLGMLDYITGPEVSFSVFYLLPISLVTWFTDRKGGVVSSVFSAIIWLVADLSSEVAYSHPLIPYWNAIVRLLVFLAIVFLGSALKDLNQDLEKRIKDRTALLEDEVVERKKVEKRLQEYAQRLEILHRIDQAILSAESLEAIVQVTLKHVQNMLHFEFVSFLLLDFEAHCIDLFERSDQANHSQPLKRFIPMEEIPDLNSMLEFLQQNDVRLQNDLGDSTLNASIAQILHAKEHPSLMLVPILIQNELIGSLNLMSSHARAFSPEHQEIGREIANQLGIAIRQARMVDQLRSDQENLQALSQELLEVQESERRNIARELHDEVGQALTSIALTLKMATGLKEERLAENLDQAHQQVIDLMERVSNLSLDLRPALLDDLGLLPTLLWHFDRYTTQTNIQVNFKHSGLDERRVAPEVETAAYRIIQEALTNVARHAGVSETWVTIWLDLNSLGIQVEDKGKGFDVEAAMASRNSAGLLGMQERALLLNGKLTIETSQGSGTRLLAEFPALEVQKG